MGTFISHSPADTLALGEAWGQAAQPGWVIGLSGDLGAGKTQLVKGLARGLGITEPVRSPTFTLVYEYCGARLPLAHLDLFRLNSPAEIFRAGLEDYLRPAGITVIEWAERWFGPAVPTGPSLGPNPGGLPPSTTTPAAGFAGRERWPERYRQVWIETLDVFERRIVYEDLGA